MVVSIVFSSILYLLSLIFIRIRLIAAPCSAFLGLLIISMAKSPEGYPLLPISSGMILGWLFMAILVTVLTLCQPKPIRQTTRGMYYFLCGALTGMALGLLGFTITTSPGVCYVIMILTTALGTFLGALMYGTTPEGKQVGVNSGHFYTYLLAKGFPTAITVMQLGTVLVILSL